MRINYFTPALPRNPFLRAVLLVCGALVLAGLLTIGLVVGTAALAVAAVLLAIRRWCMGRKPQPADPSIIDGEFTVVTEPHAPLPQAKEV